MVSRLAFKAATGLAARLADRFNIFKMYLTHAQFIEYEEGRRRYGLNRLSSNEIEATWGMQLEDPHVPKDVVEGQARIRVGSWTEFYDQESTHKVYRAIDMKEDTMVTYGTIDNMHRGGLAAERNQARSHGSTMPDGSIPDATMPDGSILAGDQIEWRRKATGHHGYVLARKKSSTT